VTDDRLRGVDDGVGQARRHRCRAVSFLIVDDISGGAAPSGYAAAAQAPVRAARAAGRLPLAGTAGVR
jgi:hypothetical protein